MLPEFMEKQVEWHPFYFSTPSPPHNSFCSTRALELDSSKDCIRLRGSSCTSGAAVGHGAAQRNSTEVHFVNDISVFFVFNVFASTSSAGCLKRIRASAPDENLLICNENMGDDT